MSLSKSNVLIFCGGGNNVGKNNSSKALQHIMNFIKNIYLFILLMAGTLSVYH